MGIFHQIIRKVADIGIVQRRFNLIQNTERRRFQFQCGKQNRDRRQRSLPAGKQAQQLQFLSGLDSERFGASSFVHYGANSIYEFKIANSYAGAIRIDNYSVPGLRLSLSGYYGHTFNNTMRAHSAEKYKDCTGALAIGAFDFMLNRCRAEFGDKVTKEDVFYFIYGVLHSPDYRRRFEADLKKSLARIPLPKTGADFSAFVKAGRKLGDLHCGYEKVKP